MRGPLVEVTAVEPAELLPVFEDELPEVELLTVAVAAGVLPPEALVVAAGVAVVSVELLEELLLDELLLEEPVPEVLLEDEPEPVTGIGRSTTTPFTEPRTEPSWPWTCICISCESRTY